MGKLKRRLATGAVALGVGVVTQPARAATFFFTDTPYQSAADIPAGFYAGGAPTLLEDFEDGSLDPSLRARIGGGILLSGFIIGSRSGTFVGLQDSVDGDDGTVDGVRTSGNSVFSGNGAAGIEFIFQGATLPTAFGVVWTDGVGAVTFSATAGDGSTLGSITRSGFADDFANGTVLEDRFFGLTSASGIKSIFIANSSGGIEVDHVQYGTMAAPVPLPAASWLMLTGLAGLVVRRRRVG
jgi:hypothetical protein